MKHYGMTAAISVLIAGLASPIVSIAQSSSLFGGQESASMQIDILPGFDENIIGVRSGRTIPVAILGSAVLDVNSINPRTIRLQGVGVMLVGKSDKSLCRQSDINDDGHLDLLCDVRTTGFRVDAGQYTIVLEAETYDKASLRGEDTLSIVRQ